MRNQVLSIEQMQHLKELGVDTSGASMMYHFWVDKKYKNCFLLSADTTTPYDSENVPTFTLQDMLEIISGCFTYEYEYKFMYHLGTWYSKYMPMIDDDDYFINSNTNPLTCAYETLCWLAENNYIGGNNGNDKTSRL